MRVAGSSLSFSRLPLAEALVRLSDLGFDAVDLGLQEGWAHVDPSTVADDPSAAAERIGAACETADLVPVALNVAAGDVPLEEEVRRIEAVAELATALGVEVTTLPAADAETSLSADLDRFGTLVEAVSDSPLTLTVETHWGTLTEDPSVAAEYADVVPGLRYTLDPGHYAVGPHWSHDAYTDLLPDVEHVHVRQAGSGWTAIQRPVDQGRIDVDHLIGQLRSVGYDGALTAEYIDSLEGVDHDEVANQATVMRDRLHRAIRRS